MTCKYLFTYLCGRSYSMYVPVVYRFLHTILNEINSEEKLKQIRDIICPPSCSTPYIISIHEVPWRRP